MDIIVGSKALEYFGYNRLKPNDVDRWVDEDQYFDKTYDVSVLPLDIIKLVPTIDGYATPDAVYTIKCSHFSWDIKWGKTKQDILWLERRGCTLIPELYLKLKDHWGVVHGNKDFLSLYKGKDSFFDDHVKYVHDHDHLHELVAFPNKPMYTRCLQDNQDVMISKAKFFNMSYEDQVRMFKEEIVVIACERWLLNPYWKGKVSVLKAYKLSLRKTVLSLTKNWANDFIVQNLKDFIHTDYKMFDHILNTLGDITMTKCDLTMIESAYDAYKEEEEGASLQEFVYYLCEDGIYGDSLKDAGFEYEHLEQDGGGEGGSEYCYGVFKLNGVIYKAEYSYYSYNGHEFDYIVDTLRVVEGKVKQVTVYE